MSTTSTSDRTETTTEPTTRRWLAAWARATLMYPTCTGPTGALALWRSLAQERRR
jgi:hypothetical protein